MFEIPKTIEIKNVFGSHSSDRILYAGIDGFPIYDETGMEAFITYGFTIPKQGGRDLSYDTDFLINILLEVNDNTGDYDPNTGDSIVGEIQALDLTLDGRTLQLDDPFKIPGKGSNRALYLFVVLKKELDAILAASNVSFKAYGTGAFFNGDIPSTAFHLYTSLFSRLGERRREILSSTQEACYDVFPDLSNVEDELSEGEALKTKRKASPSKVQPKPALVKDAEGDRLDLGGGYYYIGEIRDGKPEGKGVVYDRDNVIRQEGTYKNGELNGFGIAYVDGQKFYEGNFVNGESNGKGKQYAFGEVAYEGDFSQGKRHGKGTLFNSLDHSKYVGDFRNDTMEGTGILYIDNKKRFEGEYKNGKFHGNGVYYDENGGVAFSGRFENGLIAYETAPLKGNKWVTITYENGAYFADSYELVFNLTPQTPDLVDTLKLQIHLIDAPTKKASRLGINASFSSRGKNSLILGGSPVDLRDGKMTIRFKDGGKEVLEAKDVSQTMDSGDGSIKEEVNYVMSKDVFKRICDGEINRIELKGGTGWSHNLMGEELTFLMRASWNGIYNNNDFVSYLSQSSAAPKQAEQGCYIATALYGSYDCPEVWTLRRYRDYTLDETMPGRLLIKAYYAISPTLVRWFGDTKAFRSICRKPLDRFVISLRKKGYESTPYLDKY